MADKETDSLSLKLNNKNIFNDFEKQAKSLWESWAAFEQSVHSSSDLPPMPSTILDVLYRDVTKKTKTIALSAQFGPDYQAGMNHLVKVFEKQMKEQGESEDSVNKEIRQVQSTMQRVLATDDPDRMA